MALNGPLLYIETTLVRVEAQGAFAALMIPIRPTVAALGVGAVAVIWQWTEP